MKQLMSSLAVAGLAVMMATGCTMKGDQGMAKRGMESYTATNPVVKPGVEVLFENPHYFDLIRGKRVGLITNPTGVASDLTSTIDLLHEHPEVTLVRLFAPEHGVRGEAYAGEKVKDQADPKTGVPIQSVYGATRRPPAESLDNIDVMLYDIQDIGSRSYTYIYTMAYAMEECAKRGIPFMVLDRPNPAGAHIVDGNVLDTDEYSTFVGLYEIPYQYGMTPGETASLFNAVFNSDRVDLTVVPMEGYRRDMMHWDTGLPFVPTSTHIPSPRHAVYYNLTGIIGEIPWISIGVGYTLPFEVIAAPWIDADEFTTALRAKNLPGMMIRPISFRPAYSRFSSQDDRFEGAQMIHGAQFIITDYNAIRPVTAQVHIMEVLQRLYPEQGLFSDEKAQKCLFDEVTGTDRVREMILRGATAEEITATWPAQRAAFEPIRQQHLMY